MLETMRVYVQQYALVQNRVDMINVIMGYNEWEHGAPCRVTDTAEGCTVSFVGRLVVSWERWDLAGIDQALAIMTMLDRALWDARCMFADTVKKSTANQ